MSWEAGLRPGARSGEWAQGLGVREFRGLGFRGLGSSRWGFRVFEFRV